MVDYHFRLLVIRLWNPYQSTVCEMGTKSGDCKLFREKYSDLRDSIPIGNDLSGNESQKENDRFHSSFSRNANEKASTIQH